MQGTSFDGTESTQLLLALTKHMDGNTPQNTSDKKNHAYYIHNIGRHHVVKLYYNLAHSHYKTTAHSFIKL